MQRPSSRSTLQSARDLRQRLFVMNESPAFRRAKILCTLGPASRDPVVFKSLVEAGLDDGTKHPLRDLVGPVPRLVGPLTTGRL